MSQLLRTAIQAVADQIRRHEHLYYVLGTPEISDQQFDALMQSLRRLESQLGEPPDPNSPTQRVGSDLATGAATIAHSSPMLSLDNLFTDDEVEFWLSSIPDDPLFVVEPKIDGLALAIRYKAGKLECAITRGDGAEGADVTAQVRTIRTVPQVLPTPEDIEVRGEVYLSNAAFSRCNEIRAAEGLTLFANPRNAAVGTLKSQQLDVVASRGLNFLAYQVVGHSMDIAAQRAALVAGRFAVPEAKLVRRGEVINAIKSWGVSRMTLPFVTDGTVVKVSDRNICRELGSSQKAPRWAAAFKFPPEQVQTVVQGIDAQVGRTGVVTPVARLLPVYVSGSVVSNATLHNYPNIRAKDIRVGDTVVIQKAGEIIPEVVEVVYLRRPGDAAVFEAPTKCPCCDSWLTPASEQVVATMCPNPACPDVVKRKIEYFCSQACMDIDSVGPAVVAKLVDAGGVRDVADLYQLTEERLKQLWPSAGALIARLLQSIETSKTQPAWRVFAGLGIPMIGSTLSKALLDQFGDIGSALYAASTGSDAITEMHGMGTAKVLALKTWCDNPGSRELISRLSMAGLNLAAAAVQRESEALAGTVWCITGTLSIAREDAEQLIVRHGGVFKSGVSKKTTHLMVGAEAGATKLNKARQLGTVRIVEEGDWRAMIGIP